MATLHQCLFNVWSISCVMRLVSPLQIKFLLFNSLFSTKDEKKFRKKLSDTKVNQTKNLEEWDWEYILQIFESGVLNDEQVLEDVLKTRFLKRLLKFYFPRKKGFVTLDYCRENFKYAKVGYYLIKTLVGSKIGRKVSLLHQNHKRISFCSNSNDS